MSVENYSKAIEMEPKFEKAYPARACLLMKKLNYKAEAIEDRKRPSVFTPKEKELYYTLGVYWQTLRNTRKQTKCLRKALERDKGYTEAITAEVSVLLN